MATKKRISTSGKVTPKRTSAFAEPAGQLYGLIKNTEPATKRAIEILKPYQRSLRSPSAKLIAIKNGLDSHAISDLIEITGATQMDLAQILNITEPTLRKHIKAGKELNTGLSEHILQLFQLFDKGMDTFGSLEEFKSWLKHESIALSARPVDVLDTMTGINMVMDELIRIDYGITV
ncbi:putative toxin-antitoxin system antitoxin component (TIGR02293 family) [Pedobacter sp. CAN_A7]|uniref:type II RES/Xre toxin-antitoxin system antitoxin n=1 Tax=Pedobacter sp. CAN_A7 TaxID=2787722 RepID=UPI0018C9059B